MDQKNKHTATLILSSSVFPDLLLHSLPLFDPSFLSDSPHLSSILGASILL